MVRHKTREAITTNQVKINGRPFKKFKRIKGSIVKHLVMQNYKPYEKVLRHFTERGDIWMVSQGEYVAWWQARENATLSIKVSNGVCRVKTSLDMAVIENFPGEFLNTSAVRCEKTEFSGELWITIDPALENKDLLIELLKREGILNFQIAEAGDFMLSQTEMGPLLKEIKSKLRERGRLFEEDVPAVRQIIIDKLTARNLPLLRVWYHPQINGTVMKAVFSPRYDVDRAITNLRHIRKLEHQYGVSSTLYLRAFCPFYTDREIEKLASQPWCSEIGLHGEFVTNAHYHGDELKAAIAEKKHLEKLIRRPVQGVCLHGGELTSNTTANTPGIVQQAEFLYDTTPNMEYYFPFKMMTNGQLSQSYALIHPTGDIKMPVNLSYGRVFYQRTIAKMNEIYEKNGVFVIMLHPVYFGFFKYLFNPVNWWPFVKFLWKYLR